MSRERSRIRREKNIEHNLHQTIGDEKEKWRGGMEESRGRRGKERKTWSDTRDNYGKSRENETQTKLTKT